MKPIETERLIIRNWREEDRALFHLINSDERVMQFFPFRRDRAQSDVFMDRLRQDIAERGYGFTALERKADGRCVGFAGLNAEDVVPSLPAGTVEIGWRLAPQFWGNGYATEAAKALLDFGFAGMGLDEIISFAVWNNRASLAIMKRIGMERCPTGDFDHPRVPDSHPELKRHALYRLSRDKWRARHRQS